MQPLTRDKTVLRGRGPIRAALLAAAIFLTCHSASAGVEEGKITYVEHVRPIFAAHCFGCHNTDKQRAGLDLTSFTGVMAGSSGGAVLAPGSPDESTLFAVVSHARQPNMPPNQPKLDDATLETLRQWIAQGVYNTRDSRAPAPKKSASLNLALGDLPKRPDDISTLMPRGLPLADIVTAKRAGNVSALAGQTWAPLVAIAGQKQVLLFEPRRGELLGALPFTAGFPRTLHFSRSGQLLIAGGGVGAQAGSVTLFKMRDGSVVGTLGEEFDSVLAADLDATQQRLALGGPGRIVKILRTADGSVEHRIEKHTEWITALAYSPDAVLLATADRNGSLQVWEAISHASFHELEGHDAAIADLAWRIDGDVLASAAEDGRIRLWEMHHGKRVADFAAHGGGVLAIDFGPEGTLVSGGRDRAVKLWSQDGKAIKTLGEMSEIVTSVAFCDGGKVIVAGDLAGDVRVWNVEDGQQLATLDVNPRPFGEQLSEVRAEASAATGELVRLEAARTELDTRLADARTSLAQLGDQVGPAQAALQDAEAKLTAATTQRDAAQKGLDEARASVSANETNVAALAQESLAATEALGSAARQDAAAQRALAEAESAGSQDPPPQAAEPTEPQTPAGATVASDIESLRKRATATAAALQAAQSQVEKSKAKLAEARSQRDAAQAIATEKREVLTLAQASLSQAQVAANDARAVLDQRTANHAAAEAAMQAAEAEAGPLDNQLVAARARDAAAGRTAAKWEAGEIRKQLDESRSAMPSLEQDAATARSDADRTRGAADAAQHRLAEAEAELAGGDQLRSQRQADVETAQAQLANNKRLLEQLREQLQACGEVEPQLTAGTAAVTSFAEKQQDLPESFAKAAAAAQQAKGAWLAARKSLESAIEDATFAIEDSQFEWEATQQAAAKTDERLAALPNEIERLRSEMESASSHAAEMEGTAAAAELRLQEAKAQLQSLEDQYAQRLAAWLD